MKNPHPPRSRDEELLEWVAERAAGTSCSAIAKRLGLNSGIVVTATNNVFRADKKESRERRIERHYWKEKA
jgi:transposase